MDWLLITLAILLLLHTWLAAIANIALWRTNDLERTQKIIQGIVVWAIPYFGAKLVLNLLKEHDEEAIPERWIPNRKINSLVKEFLQFGARGQNRAAGSAIENEIVDSIGESMSGTGGGDGGGE